MSLDGWPSEWLNLVVRWFHVVAGVMWLGQTYLFNRLEGRLAEAARAAGKVEPVWLVHSGGFYIVHKDQSPPQLPPKLHWFKWESALTWVSGLLLLLIVYYAGGLLTSDPDVRFGWAATVGLGMLPLAWIVYDLLCRSPLGRHERAMAATGFLLLVGLAVGLGRVLSPRAAYIHVGATMGTIMFANVWELILPTQRKMIAAIAEGKRLDPALEDQAMLRTRHNTYLSLPLIFIMVSNHFPTATYGHVWGPALLGVFLLVGFGAAHLLRKI
jgi:uncharacterized membrane protein